MSLVLLFNGQGGYTPPVSTYGFTQPKDVIVRVQALDGAWETCGADRARGIVPENVQLVSDQWGSKTASFDLRRDPKAIWPDISAFAPVEVEVGGRLVWSGRVAETPVRDSTDSVIGVQCEGWQAHLDDDLYERIYAHTNLTDWVDARGLPGAVLTTWLASGSVETGNGNIVIGWANAANVANGQHVGVVLDLGPNSTAKRVVVDFSNENVAAGFYEFRCRAFDDIATFAGTGETVFSVEPATALSPQAATLTTARRYLALYLVRTGVSTTENGDRKVRITAAQVFADTAYESGNTSILKADQVVKDALSRATLLLSSDQSGISAGTFSIPELSPSDPKTPREMWNAVNAFEDYQAEIDVLKRPVFRAKPSSPEVEVGAWSGMEFEDSSANSGGDVYSGVVVTGTQADGSPLRVTRTQAQQPGVLSTALTTPAVTNPSFATNTSGWSLSGASSTITRDTVTFDSSPASLRWDLTGASDNLSKSASYYLTGATTGTFRKGVTYTLSVRVRPSAAGPSYTTQLRVVFGDYSSPYTNIAAGTTLFNSNAWQTLQVAWTPAESFSGNAVQIWSLVGRGGNAFFYIDSLSIAAAQPTIIERRSFARTKQVASSFTLTTPAAQQIADKWLLSHKTSPFKGRAKLTGNQACREIKTGRPVKPEELLLRTGELIRFGDRIDPDTGATGRDGRLVEAQYEADTDSVTLTIDSSRAGFEALLERLGVVLGQNRFS